MSPPQSTKFNERELESYRLRLINLARTKVQNRDDVEDVVQDTMIRAFESQAQYDASKPMYPWLVLILHNIIIDRYRSDKRRVDRELKSVDLQMIEDFTDSPPDQQRLKAPPIVHHKPEDAAIFDEWLVSLSYDEQIIALLLIDGYSQQEICAALCMDKTAVWRVKNEIGRKYLAWKQSDGLSAAA